MLRRLSTPMAHLILQITLIPSPMVSLKVQCTAPLHIMHQISFSPLQYADSTHLYDPTSSIIPAILSTITSYQTDIKLWLGLE